MPRRFIAGCGGTTLDRQERQFFRDAEPWGFILFARNIETPDQVRHLVIALREAVGREDAPILIDQEGGRVQRLRPPHWPSYPPAAKVGALLAKSADEARRAAWLHGRLIAEDLFALGISVDCAPVLDLSLPQTHEVIGDRAYDSDPDSVAALAEAFAEGLGAGGVVPVVKHIPGHGRAECDSHLELPRVAASREELASADFEPFRRLARLPVAMTAHILYEGLDGERCATVSPMVVGDIIRGEIGFEGLLLTDDLSMKAMSGSLRERTEAALAAGCDMALHCNGDMGEMAMVADAAPSLAGQAAERAEAALGWPRREVIDIVGARIELRSLLGLPEPPS